MLQAVRFYNGRYGIQNTWTGILLTDKNGKVLEFRKSRKAVRRIYKLNNELSKVIERVTK
jgi:hypothetical protein